MTVQWSGCPNCLDLKAGCDQNRQNCYNSATKLKHLVTKGHRERRDRNDSYQGLHMRVLDDIYLIFSK